MTFKLTIFSFTLISLFSCSQEKVDYHTVNQPKYRTDNFLDHENNNRKIYNGVLFHEGKRQSYTDISFDEQLIRSLKGNIKSVKFRKIDSDGQLAETQIYQFDKKGKIEKKFLAYQNYPLDEVKCLRDTLFVNLDQSAKDSISINSDMVEYVFYKGKLYAENSNLYTNFPHRRNTYHPNGNKATSRRLTNWEIKYYNQAGVLDSIVDPNAEKNPTENNVERFNYKNNLIEKFVSEQNKLIDNNFTTTYARVVNATYYSNTDLPLFVDENSYNDNYKTIGSKESRKYSYNNKNELSKVVHIFEGENPKYMEMETNYRYEYDKQGNWTKVTLTGFHKDTPTEKFVIQYLIEYEYY